MKPQKALLENQESLEQSRVKLTSWFIDLHVRHPIPFQWKHLYIVRKTNERMPQLEVARVYPSKQFEKRWFWRVDSDQVNTFGRRTTLLEALFNADVILAHHFELEEANYYEIINAITERAKTRHTIV